MFILGVDKGVNVSKRKLGELECDKVKTIKKNKSSVKQTKIKDVEHGIEPRLLKGTQIQNFVPEIYMLSPSRKNNFHYVQVLYTKSEITNCIIVQV